MLNEPTWAEIARWKERLEDRHFQRRLLRFQSHVYQVFEDLRTQTGLEPIRAIMKRDEVKSLGSTVEKIRRRREDQIKKRVEQGIEERPYDFNDMRDLIGIKILCPYKKNVDIVIDYLYRQNKHFRILEFSKDTAERKTEFGYRGYHFTVYPIEGAPAGWTPLYCEIQIKTIIEEAWDAQTHDVTYKKENAIPTMFVEFFRHYSDILRDVEKQGEFFRRQVDALFSDIQEHRKVATLSSFYLSLDTLREMTKRYSCMPQIEGPRESFTAEEISQINEALRCECITGNLSREKCHAATFIAVCQFPDPEQIAFALHLIEEFAERGGNTHTAEALRAHANWALSRFSQAVEYGQRAVLECEQKGLEAVQRMYICSDFCYYTADAIMFNCFVPEETIRTVRKLIEELKVLYINNPGNHDYLGVADTTGFVKIVLGKNYEEVNEGVKLVKEVFEIGRNNPNQQIKKMAEAYCLRHIELGEKRLRELYRR